jgi:6-phosphofructokinase 2
MSSIITFTFNPCIDKSFSVATLLPEIKLAAGPVSREPGGGGINIARAIHRLGGDARAVFPAGGYFGEMLFELLAEERVPIKPLKIMGETRENVNITESSTGHQYRFVLPGPALQDDIWEECLAAAGELAEGGFIVVSGSLPQGWPADLFRRLRAVVENKRARLVVDSSGAALKAALQAGVYLVKPSLRELDELAVALDLRGATPLEKARQIIAGRYASVVLLSAGAAGVLLVTDEEAWEIAAPEVCKNSSVGAGDCLLAGTLLRLAQHVPLLDAVRYGVACSVAAVMNPGTARCEQQDAEKLFHDMAAPRRLQTSIPSILS